MSSTIDRIVKLINRRKPATVFAQILIAILAPTAILSIALYVFPFSSQRLDTRAVLERRGQTLIVAVGQAMSFTGLIGDKTRWHDVFRSIIESDPSIKRLALLDARGVTLIAFGEIPVGGDEVVVEGLLPKQEFNKNPGSVSAIFSVDEQDKGIAQTQLRDQFLTAFIILLAMVPSIVAMRNLVMQLGKSLAPIFDQATPPKPIEISLCNLNEAVGLRLLVRKEITEKINKLVLERTDALSQSNLSFQQAGDERRELLARSQEDIEKVRRRIARGLHDSLNAEVVGIRLRAETIIRLALQSGQNDLVDLANGILNGASQLYDSTRKIVEELRPELLDSVGFKDAIKDEVRRLQKAFPACAITFLGENVEDVNEEKAMAAFRTVQEALSNTVKHAQATLVNVIVERADPPWFVRVTVADNGRGFQPLSTESGIAKRFGLAGMRERVESAGGILSITSTSSGTMVTAVL